jgi:uncharacterized membrane protein YcaP (DUF421 family)
MTNAFLLVLTFLAIDVAISHVALRSDRFDKLIDDVPLILIEDGTILRDRMKKARVKESDILQSARMQEGIEKLDDIKYAILERSGGISVVPQQAK